MDDESGWNEVLVEGWGPLVRAAVADRVEEAFTSARGLLARTATDPDRAPTGDVELVHDQVVAAILAETGADLDLLGSQAAWATYDDVWAELGRRWADGRDLERVPDGRRATVVGLLAGLPASAVTHAGAHRTAGGTLVLLDLGGTALVDVEGLFRWLATDAGASADQRDRARQVVAAVRQR